MAKKPLSIEQIAIETKEYAQKHIKKGSSQLENNSYSEASQLALMSGIYDLRDEVAYNISSSKKDTYEVEIETIKKHSLGNCYEMAKMALHYILTTHPQFYAHIYYIGNGDHSFLVIGKKKPSTPMLLDSWDQESYICDPWSNIAYPVAEWEEKLKNYACIITDELSKDAKRLQKDKYNYLKKNGIILKKSMVRRNTSLTRIPIYNKNGKKIGRTSFFYRNTTNVIMPLNDRQFLIPEEGYNSISLYQHGLTYRREKIKSVLILLRSFKAVFQRTECLDQLLGERYLLEDHSLGDFLMPNEILRRENIIKQAINLLENFGKYLKNLKNESEFRKKFALPILDQLRDICSAIDCLEQLLKRRAVYDIDLFNTHPTIDSKFTIAIKEVLEKYLSPISKKAVVEWAIAQTDGDINSFIHYFYTVLKPTLEIRRNPSLDKVRGFFTLKPVTVKGSQVVQQLEELIDNYSKRLRSF